MRFVPKPRWGLRSFLVFVLFAGSLSGLGSKLRQEYLHHQHLAATVRELGGEVKLRPAGPQLLRKLAGDKYLMRVRTINFWAVDVTDEQFARLGSLDGVEKLWIIGSRITDESLRSIAKCDSLISLHLGGNDISDDGIASLVALKRLERLYLGITPLTDEALEHIGRMSQLRALHLGPDMYVLHGSLRALYSDRKESGTPAYSAAALAHLGQLEHLEELQLVAFRHELPVEAAQWFCKLKRLDLHNAATDKTLQVVGKLHRLEAIGLENGQISDSGLTNLSSLPNLADVCLTNNAITDQGLTVLRNRPRLRRLSLSHTKVTDEGIDHFLNSESLEYLNLGSTQISDAGLKKIARFKQLKQLHLCFCKVTDEGLAQLKDLPQLEVLYTTPHTLDASTKKMFKATNPELYLNSVGMGSPWSLYSEFP